MSIDRLKNGEYNYENDRTCFRYLSRSFLCQHVAAAPPGQKAPKLQALLKLPLLKRLPLLTLLLLKKHPQLLKKHPLVKRRQKRALLKLPLLSNNQY